ncbi:hypothetical protein FOXB_16559, partial [Fusarium oxysporum f. sp. conglutinans Fo5176]
TMRTQGWGKGDGHGRLWEVLIGMEYLLEHFEDWKVFYSEVTVEPMSEAHMDAVERNVTASVNLRESNGRPSRVRRLPARFDEDEIYALPQRSQPSRFAESALPPHSRAEFSTVEKRSASEMSQKSTLPADHRAYIRASINNGWKKLNEYYDKLGESPLFAAAIILHPRFGISSLEATWVSEEQLAWVRDAKVGSKDYFTRCKTKKAFATCGSIGELEWYLRLESQDTQDAIQWWRDHRASFPSLRSFALDVFAIPAMTSDYAMEARLRVFTFRNPSIDWMGTDARGNRIPLCEYVNYTEHFANTKDFVAQLGVLRTDQEDILRDRGYQQENSSLFNPKAD